MNQRPFCNKFWYLRRYKSALDFVWHITYMKNEYPFQVKDYLNIKKNVIFWPVIYNQYIGVKLKSCGIKKDLKNIDCDLIIRSSIWSGNGILYFQFQSLFYKERFKQYVYRPYQDFQALEKDIPNISSIIKWV